MGEGKYGKGYGGGRTGGLGGERGMEGPTTRFTISGVTLRGAEVPSAFFARGWKKRVSNVPVCTSCASLVPFLLLVRAANSDNAASSTSTRLSSWIYGLARRYFEVSQRKNAERSFEFRGRVLSPV